jgi:pimeloyl-ACP methyl ester carboxylesterase
VQVPDVRYARSGDVSVAYVVAGSKPIDLVFVHGFIGNLQLGWTQPLRMAFFERLQHSTRVIEFDRRGTGLSDRVRDVPTLEARMDDLRAVMDAVGSDRAALVGLEEAAAMTALFADTYPERVGALVLWDPVVLGTAAPDYPWAPTHDEWNRELEDVRRDWGTAESVEAALREIAPTYADDPDFRSWFGGLMRTGASPGAVATALRMRMDVDVRDVLPAIRVPTLVLYYPSSSGAGIYAAERIPGARSIELTDRGPNRAFFLVEGVAEEIETFVAEAWGTAEPTTVLTTVLFTDIVSSTAHAASIGDRKWADLVESHHAIVRRHLGIFRGREVDTAGDGFFAAFDGPAREVRCASAITRSIRDLGIEVRAGVHTGECEIVAGSPAALL